MLTFELRIWTKGCAVEGNKRQSRSRINEILCPKYGKSPQMKAEGDSWAFALGILVISGDTNKGKGRSRRLVDGVRRGR